MKKIIATAALVLVAGVAFSTPATVSSGGTITNTDCTYIPASNSAGVKLATSANVAAAYECTSTGVVTGAAHTQGKKNGYLSTSAGGSQQQITLSANPTSVTDTSGMTSNSAWSTLVGQLT